MMSDTYHVEKFKFKIVPAANRFVEIFKSKYGKQLVEQCQQTDAGPAMKNMDDEQEGKKREKKNRKYWKRTFCFFIFLAMHLRHSAHSEK